jgi:hypothetical protein
MRRNTTPNYSSRASPGLLGMNPSVGPEDVLGFSILFVPEDTPHPTFSKSTWIEPFEKIHII